ncbi:hypothetical protein, partial [Halorubrum laminariae]
CRRLPEALRVSLSRAVATGALEAVTVLSPIDNQLPATPPDHFMNAHSNRVQHSLPPSITGQVRSSK